MTAATTDDEIGRLFDVLPAAFVKERNAVVKALKAAGRRDDAAAVEKLPKPTPSVWAVNQLARRVPALVKRLGEATARLQGGEHAGYAAALAEHRDALKALRLEAERSLEAAGLRPTPEVLARVVHDLRAGVMNPEARPLLERGRLVRDVGDEGAVSPFAQELPASPPISADREEADREKADREKAAAIAAQAAREQRLQQLREALASAEAERAEAASEVEAARRALADAERRLSVSSATAAQAATALEAAGDTNPTRRR